MAIRECTNVILHRSGNPLRITFDSPAEQIDNTQTALDGVWNESSIPRTNRSRAIRQIELDTAAKCHISLQYFTGEMSEGDDNNV